MASRVAVADGEAGTSRNVIRHRDCPALPPGDLWVFAYGSLMWSPEFDYVRSAPALLRGYHRAFCVRSVRYRGTPERPGLVLGLDRGGSCRGVAFLVGAARVEAAIAQLWAREMPRAVYKPRLVPVRVDGERVQALTFVSDRAHDGYAGRTDLESAARTIASCCGERGPNVDYLANTLEHLEALGIVEPGLRRLYRAVQDAEEARGA